MNKLKNNIFFLKSLFNIILNKIKIKIIFYINNLFFYNFINNKIFEKIKKIMFYYYFLYYN